MAVLDSVRTLADGIRGHLADDDLFTMAWAAKLSAAQLAEVFALSVRLNSDLIRACAAHAGIDPFDAVDDLVAQAEAR